MERDSVLRVVAVGDSAILVIVGTEPSEAVRRRMAWAVRAANEQTDLWRDDAPWVIGSTAVLRRIDPLHVSAQALAAALETRLHVRWIQEDSDYADRAPHHPKRSVRIPVCYDEEFGLDLLSLSRWHNLEIPDLVRLHHSTPYEVAMIGFLPGFPYLAGLPDSLASPRRQEPRVHVPAGSVGIGGQQTGIYPVDSPGGWQIIGRTPERLFDPDREDMFLLHPGDGVQFYPISAGEFHHREQELALETAERAEVHATGGGGTSDDAQRRMEVLKSGLLTTVQDLGRMGLEDQGVPRAGAMDGFAAIIGNLLVGNPDDAAVLECTLVGPTIRFLDAALIAVTGADLVPRLNGADIPLWTTLWVEKGSVLSFSGYRNGCRAYIAVDGGFSVQPVMGSASTDLKSSLGGLNGRALKAGDVLNMRPGFSDSQQRRGRRLASALRPTYGRHVTVGFLPSDSPSAYVQQVVDDFARSTLEVRPQSDRMGIRLQGWQSPSVRGQGTPSALLASQPVVPGTIQCPNGGSPLVLMAEAQTIGGYPTLGVVSSADVSSLAQVTPGSTVRFVPIDETEARNRVRRQHDCLRWLAMHNR